MKRTWIAITAAMLLFPACDAAEVSDENRPAGKADGQGTLEYASLAFALDFEQNYTVVSVFATARDVWHGDTVELSHIAGGIPEAPVTGLIHSPSEGCYYDGHTEAVVGDFEGRAINGIWSAHAERDCGPTLDPRDLTTMFVVSDSDDAAELGDFEDTIVDGEISRPVFMETEPTAIVYHYRFRNGADYFHAQTWRTRDGTASYRSSYKLWAAENATGRIGVVVGDTTIWTDVPVDDGWTTRNLLLIPDDDDVLELWVR